MQVLSYPTEFTVDATVTPNVFGPSVGQNPLVVKISNIPNTVGITNALPAPVREASAVQTSLNASTATIPSTGSFTGFFLPGSNIFNPAPTNFGFTNLHQIKINDPAHYNTFGTKYVRTDNGNGTFNVVLIHTRFTQAMAYVNGNDYIVVQRSFLETVEPSAMPVKSNGAGGYVIAPMTFSNTATIETETELINKANATLSNANFNSSNLLSAFYNANKNVIEMTDNASGEFSIYNLLGQSVLNGNISKEINVEALKSGLYILSTDKGVLKFAK